MFTKEVKKYLVLNTNDSPRRYYQAKGSFCGTVVCPTNPNKFSEVSCTVSFSEVNGFIYLIRITSGGPPPFTAACNLIVSAARGGSVDSLITAASAEKLITSLGLDLSLSELYGFDTIENAVLEAVTSHNDSKK